MRLHRIVHGAVLALVLLAAHSHGEDQNGSAHASELRTTDASAASAGPSGSATPTTTPLVTSAPKADADAGDETPTPTPTATATPSAAMASTESTTDTPSPSISGGRGRSPVTSPSQTPKENNSSVTEPPPPAPVPGPTPSPSEGTTTPAPSPIPDTDTTAPPPNPTSDVSKNGDVTDTPQVTTEPPESPPPPVAMVPPGLVQPSPVAAETTSPPDSSPAPDAGSPSPPRPPQVYTNPPSTVANENREASGSTDAGQAPASPTDSTSSAPVATVEVTVKDDSGTVETTPRPKAYRRGDNIIVIQKDNGDGTTVDVEVVVSPAEAPAVLVRNANTQSSGSSGSSSSGASDAFSTLLRIVMSILAFVSLLVLVVFHFVALQPSWTSSLSVLARPNQWELLVFITYIQAMASTSQYLVRYAPTSLWKFVDAFSWTVFIPFHHSNSGVSTSTSRRLTDLVVLDGVVAFADRIGVDETSLLQTSAAGLVVSCGVVALLVCVAVSVIKYRSRTTTTKDASDPLALGSLPGVVSVFRPDYGQMPPMYIVYGATVVFGVFCLYPVTLMATFEIASQVRADQISGSSLAIALLLIVAVPVVLIIRSIPALALIPSEDAYKTNWRHRALWGILSSSECTKYGQRVSIAIAWLAMQLASAVIVAAVVSDVWQILLLLAVDVVFIGMVLILRPFAAGHRLATIFTVSIGVLKAVNASLAFMFVSASSHHNATATAFIALNSLVITLWLVRLAFIATRVVHSVRSNAEPLVREHASLSLDAAYESSLFVALPTTRDGHHGPRQAIL